MLGRTSRGTSRPLRDRYRIAMRYAADPLEYAQPIYSALITYDANRPTSVPNVQRGGSGDAHRSAEIILLDSPRAPASRITQRHRRLRPASRPPNSGHIDSTRKSVVPGA